jgi:hypothetical protein
MPWLSLRALVGSPNLSCPIVEAMPVANNAQAINWICGARTRSGAASFISNFQEMNSYQKSLKSAKK